MIEDEVYHKSNGILESKSEMEEIKEASDFELMK